MSIDPLENGIDPSGIPRHGREVVKLELFAIYPDALAEELATTVNDRVNDAVGEPHLRDYTIERDLTGEVGKRHFMMARASFDAMEEAALDLVRIAESLKPTFEGIFLLQTASLGSRGGSTGRCGWLSGTRKSRALEVRGF